jgi:hypothetical protein
MHASRVGAHASLDADLRKHSGFLRRLVGRILGPVSSPSLRSRALILPDHMIQFVWLDVQLARCSTCRLLGFAICESVPCCFLEKPMDHTVRLHAWRAEEHQEVVGCRVTDSGNGAERERHTLRVTRIDLASLIYAVLQKDAGRLSDCRCFRRSGRRRAERRGDF